MPKLRNLVVASALVSLCSSVLDIDANRARGQDAAQKQGTGLVITGTTSLPAGHYNIVNRDTRMRYTLDVDQTGKMKLDEMHRPALNAAPANTAAQPAATPAATTATAAASATGAQAATAAGDPAAAAAGSPPAQPETSKDKIQNAIKREAERQLRKHGGKVEDLLKKF